MEAGFLLPYTSSNTFNCTNSQNIGCVFS